MRPVAHSLVLLDEENSGRAFVQMKDGDRFLVAVADAARACRAFENAQEFGKQFGRLIDVLTEWVKNRRDSIKSAHLKVRERDVLFLIVQKQARFDQQLMDELVQFDLDIANDPELALLQLETLCIPSVSADSLHAFLSTGEVYTNAE